MRENRSPRNAVFAVVAVVALLGATVWFVTRSSQPKMVLVGDSLMVQTAPAIERSADAHVVAKAVSGTGLLSRAQFDWIAAAKRIAVEQHPDLVVALFIGNCKDPAGLDPAHPVACASPEFFAQWQQAADQITSIFERSGAHVFWVLPPPMPGDLEARAQALTRAYWALAATHHHVSYVDGAAALGNPSGAYLASIRDQHGRPEPLRAADGIHLAPAGAARLANAIVVTTSL